MAKFKYKFETIKGIKRRFEKKAQKELAVIDLDIASKRNEILDLTQKLKEEKRKKLEDKNKKTIELQFYEKYESYLRDQIEMLREYISKRIEDRNKKMEELLAKSKETKTFEKIEENHFLDFVKSQNKLEQKEMDEFAAKEYIKEK